MQNQFATIKQTTSHERIINVPQGSIASDIQQVEDLNDMDKNSDIEQIDNQEKIENDEQTIINNLNLDTNEVNQN